MLTKENAKIASGVLIILVAVLMSINGENDQIKSDKKTVSMTQSSQLNEFNCMRTEPYPMPEEFKRALSLRKQRLLESGQTLNLDFSNCINVQYADLRLVGGAEGVFYFDDNISSANNLMINIDNVYRFNDDILLSVVLDHEMQHVAQFIAYKKTGKVGNCIEKERDAFFSELQYIKTLNNEEKDSLLSRLKLHKENQANNKYSENFFSSLYNLIDIAGQSMRYCDELMKKEKTGNISATVCRENTEMKAIEYMLTENKYCSET